MIRKRSRNRKFQVGDEVRVTKEGRYGSRFGMEGTVVGYRLRVYRGTVAGSCYRVDFDGAVVWIETEYLSRVEEV